MSMATITGQLVDSDDIPWINALWSAVPVSPSSTPVYADGTEVLAVFGQLDDTGAFSGEVPRTDSIRPNGTTLMFTIHSVTSAPPSIVENIHVTTPTVNLGALLSPLITAPRIPSANLVYAYSDIEVLNPSSGDGYVNTTDKLPFAFLGNEWVVLNSGPGDQIYPANGIAVSTGTAWAASINPATVPRTNTPNTFTADQTINGEITAQDGVFTGLGPGPSGQGLYLDSFPDATGRIIMRPSPTASPSTLGTIALSADTGDGTRSQLYMEMQPTGDSFGAAVISAVPISMNNQFRLGDRSWGLWTTGTPNINSDASNLFLNSSGTGSVQVNVDEGNGGLIVGNGAGGQAAKIDSAGDGIFNGFLRFGNVSSTGNDFNTMNSGGFYVIGPTANAPPSTDTRNFIVLVISSPTDFGGFAIQLAWNFNVAGEVWTRQFSFGTWGEWFQFTTVGHLAEAIAAPRTTRQKA